MEKTIEQMALDKNKAIAKAQQVRKEMESTKSAQIKLLSVLNNATNLIIKYPDWEEKLDEIIKCARIMEAMIDYSYKFKVDRLKELMGGIIKGRKEDDKPPF